MSDAARGVVLDSSAVLAVILGEPGSAFVRPRLSSGKLSIVNYAEVLARLTGKGVPISEAVASADGLDIEVLPLTSSQAVRSAVLRPITRSIGLSLGDRACLALAFELRVPALTADRAWQSVAAVAGVDVELIR